MSTLGYLSRVRTVMRALGLARGRTRRQRWTRDQLLAFQRQRLGELVEHATRGSAFYRRLYGGKVGAGEVELSRLPVVTKAAMMSSFDEVVTDPRLTTEGVDAHTGGPTCDALHLGEYRLISTSGSTGLRGVFAFSRQEWLDVVGTLFTVAEIAAARPTLPRQRVVSISAPGAKHISYQMLASADIGLYRVVRLPATLPLDELVAAVGRHAPNQMTAYPSVASMLAQEQLAGRLRIAPRIVNTFGEVRTDEMTGHIRAAWGVEPFNGYAITEGGGAVGQDCEAHAGMHVLEDSVILESVDAANRPVAPGTVGSKLLLTNLWLRTQPLIRYEVSDLIAFDERPCACGRTTKRIVAIDGRSDDILELPAQNGASVAVHPIHLRSPLGALPDVAQYQIVQEGRALAVAIVPRRDAPVNGLAGTVKRTLETALRNAGTAGVTVEVRVVDELLRGAGGKLKLVERRRSVPTANPPG
jgi:phenylacetate-coenzyme A ligase PaaK-like adenylate-forming protein